MHCPLLSTTIIKENNNTRSNKNFSNYLGMWVDGKSSYPSTWREVVQAIAPTIPVRGITYCRHVMWG